MILPNAPRAKSSLWENSHAFAGTNRRTPLRNQNTLLLRRAERFCDGLLCCAKKTPGKQGVLSCFPGGSVAADGCTACVVAKVLLQVECERLAHACGIRCVGYDTDLNLSWRVIVKYELA